MMLSHPVLLGLFWLLLLSSTSGQSHVSTSETNKVYSYSYHIQHNGTTNSKEILRRVLGVDPEIGIDTPDEKAIVKTFSSPSIRGFFTKGVLPAGPLSRSFNPIFRNPVSTNPAIDEIKKVAVNNLQPPNTNIITGLLPPISPDISREFPGDFNGVNHLGNDYQNRDDFPKIPPPPPLINNNGVSQVQSFAKNTPDGGKIVGEVETYAFNPPPVVNSGYRHQENAEGFRRNENILNDREEVTGHRTQSYFKQQFRTVTPNLEGHNFPSSNRIDNNNNNNNQWWNVLNVFGERTNYDQNSGNLNQQTNYNNPRRMNIIPKPHIDSGFTNLRKEDLSNTINNNINQITSNVNDQLNRAFGSRLSGFNRQNGYQNRQGANAHNSYSYRNQDGNANKAVNLDFPMKFEPIAVVNNELPRNTNPTFSNINNNNVYHNLQNSNNGYRNDQSNQFHENAENLIQDVNSQLKNLHDSAAPILNNVGLTWDDDMRQNINNDWSRRQPNNRPFSNGHSGPLYNPPVPIKPVNFFKSTLEALVGGRDFNKEFQIPPIGGSQGGSYHNSGGGGVEKFFGIDKIMEGPNSYSRNQQRRYERNFQTNSNSGFERTNQWSGNSLRRLDAQSSKDDFSKDFIDVFRDDY
ncbi:probable cyclin-dependent serine/threonine-protein kinase DDB_G0292550 [Uloborus diversus]|uniref:probable cyclin-dependent serine/threonine-protein kinase DDB_G0292550 n=1 Tax=Uloborus diversus TaxID=327109 RepID=UPI0024098096|nr:probable cyclin-dependent serine/threonine-protein kinase DDB_G0292550 [Uloborus diversus]